MHFIVYYHYINIILYLYYLTTSKITPVSHYIKSSEGNEPFFHKDSIWHHKTEIN